VDELTTAGFHPLDPVLSGRESWSNYYEPLRERLLILSKQGDHPQALIDVMAAFEREIDVFDCTGDEVALSFFLARWNSTPE